MEVGLGPGVNDLALLVLLLAVRLFLSLHHPSGLAAGIVHNLMVAYVVHLLTPGLLVDLVHHFRLLSPELGAEIFDTEKWTWLCRALMTV